MRISIFLVFLSILVVFSACECDSQRRDRFLQLGNLALEDGDYEKAVGLYNESLKVDAEYGPALNNRGVAQIEMGHPYEAILDYNRAIMRNPEYLDALFNRAYAYEEIGKYQKALKDVGTIMRLRPDSAFVYFYQGLVQTKMLSYDEALQSFLRADTLNPLNPETMINIATIHYLQGNLEQANALVSEVFGLNAQDENAFNLLSLIRLEQEDYLGALVEINRALDEVPEEPYFLNNRGFVYLRMDSLDRALKDIDQSILLNPKNGWAYRNKGIYYLKSGDADQAIRLLNRALDEPDFIDEIYVYLGIAYLERGESEKACESWKNGAEANERRSREMLNQNCPVSFTNSN